MTEPFAISETSPSDKPRPSFQSIQVLRAVAAFAVLLFHEKLLAIGYGGVDIFFVISGFIMGTFGSRQRPLAFMGNRIARIVPLYWLVTLALCAMSLVPHAFNTFAFDRDSLTKSLLFIPYLDQTGHVWPLMVAGWTLNYEMFFYLIFALGLMVNQPRVLTPLVMLALVAAGLLFHSSSPILQTYSDPLLLEFAAGLGLSRLSFAWGRWLGLALFLGAIALFAMVAISGGPEDGLSRIIFLGIPAMALVAGALTLERAGCWPRIRLLEAAGDASYSLYLLHGIIIAFTAKFLPLPPMVNDLLAIGLSLGAALLSYRLFELPVARLLRRLARVWLEKPIAVSP